MSRDTFIFKESPKGSARTEEEAVYMCKQLLQGWLNSVIGFEVLPPGVEEYDDKQRRV
jgi:hypothetical protein